MANVKVELDYKLYDGMSLTFKAPCDCTAVTGLIVYYPDVENDTEASKVFVFKDTHGNELTGIGNLFSADSYVKVVLDIVNGFAYVQNADTNGYLEGRFAKCISRVQFIDQCSWWADGMTTQEFFTAMPTDTAIITQCSNHNLNDKPTQYFQCVFVKGSNDNYHHAIAWQAGTTNGRIYEYVGTASGGKWSRMLTAADFTLTNGVLNITTT